MYVYVCSYITELFNILRNRVTYYLLINLKNIANSQSLYSTESLSKELSEVRFTIL